MRSMMAAALVLAMAGQAAAIECPLTHARYEQGGTGWVLRFMPVPHDAAVNQIAAFEITLPGAPATVLGGAVYIANGYGQAWGIVTQAAGNETEPFWEGVVYSLGATGIEELPHEAGQMAPQQILLPQFSSTVWYSMLREAAFPEAGGVLDTFSLAACAK